MAGNITERQIQLGGVRCNLARAGEKGAPLVMLHGVTRRWQTFLPILPSLAARWSVAALDFRGHGRSVYVDSPYRVVDYGADVLHLLRNQFDEPAILYGHSLGAMVAAAVAAESPQLIRALILEDPPLDTMGRRIAETPLLSYFQGMQEVAGSKLALDTLAHEVADLWLKDPFTGDQKRLGGLRDAAALRFTAMCLSQLDPAVLLPIVAGRWLDGYEQAEIFAKIEAPVLLLQADPQCGGMLIDEDAHRIQRQIASCTVVRYPQVGHLIHADSPQAVSGAVHNFLESLEDQRDLTCQRAIKEIASEDI
ncbi:MAG: alpha/beta fold hydrolase [Blastopirellula sp. JB062]